MLKRNQYYFEISKNNPEPHLDQNYFVLEKYPELKFYISGIKEIKEILITIKKLQDNKEDKNIIEKYFLKLFKVFQNNFSNCSELGCFVNACDTTRDLIKNDLESFKKITNLFIKKRILDDKVPENWVQAIIDSNSSRKKGDFGEKKIINILNKLRYVEVKSWDDFNKFKKCVARFSKDVFSTSSIRKNLNLKIKTKKQDKRLDLLIKNNKNIFLLEAKHLNTGGGEQDKQISELIEIVGLPREREGVFYISFLDGTYSNLLLGEIRNNSKKKLKQRKEIEKYLKKNKNNFWVNTAGLYDLLKNLN